jgi:ATP-dependent DNA ligase
VKKKGETTLFSRRGNISNRKFPYVASALKGLPDDTILDGEVVALDNQGRSDFNLLQNFRSAESKIHYYCAIAAVHHQINQAVNGSLIRISNAKMVLL